MTTPVKDLLHLSTLTPEHLDTIRLLPGRHRLRAEGVCATEALAWITGSPHSDTPSSVCPTINAVLRDWNDRLDDRDRNTILKPLLPALAHSNQGLQAARDRAHFITDWLVHDHIPAWLSLASNNEAAQNLRNTPRVTSHSTPDQFIYVRNCLLLARRQTDATLRAQPLKHNEPAPDVVRRSGYWSFLHAGLPHALTQEFSPQRAAEAAHRAGADMDAVDQYFQEAAAELLNILLTLHHDTKGG